MKLDGMVLDLYDDTSASLLAGVIKQMGHFPEKLASSRLLSEQEREELPDRLFAMVATNQGASLRKFAMHDESHLLTSLLYFSKTAGALPDSIRQKVASNLVMGCGWYGIDVPESLTKLAGLAQKAMASLGLADIGSRVKGDAQTNRQAMEGLRQAQASGMKTAGRTVELTMDQDAALQRGEGQSRVMELLEEFSDHTDTEKKLKEQLEKQDQVEPGFGKKADLTGTELMPHGAQKTSPHRMMPGRKPERMPQKLAWQHCGDLSALELVQEEPEVAAPEHYALVSRYPIDTAEQVKRAAAYFDEYYHSMPLEDRRMFSQSVLLRAEELGTKVAGAVLNYGGEEYGPFIESELHARINGFTGTGHEAVYELLQEKRAEISPVIMAAMLLEADRETGADNAYGRPGSGFLDPYAAVYGKPKLAAEKELKAVQYSWSQGNDYVSAAELEQLAKSSTNLDEMFGKGFGNSYRSDPVAVFESMPTPQKVVISRLAAKAAGNETGT